MKTGLGHGRGWAWLGVGKAEEAVVCGRNCEEVGGGE